MPDPKDVGAELDELEPERTGCEVGTGALPKNVEDEEDGVGKAVLAVLFIARALPELLAIKPGLSPKIGEGTQ